MVTQHLPGEPIPVLNNLSVKKFFLISDLNLPWCSLRPFLLILPPVRRYQPCSAAITFQVFEEGNKVSPQPPLPQTKQPQFLQSLLIGRILPALPQTCSSTSVSFLY